MFLRKGPGWRTVGANPVACGVFLVTIYAGRIYRFSTRNVSMKSLSDVYTGGSWIDFEDAIVNNISYKEEVDIFNRRHSVQSLEIEVMADRFPFMEIRKSGIILQDINVDVHWYVTGNNFAFDQAYHILNGKLSEPRYDEEREVVTFKVEESSLSGNDPFPPIVAVDTLLSSLDDEASGKPYPVVVGSVKKLPVFDIDNVSHDTKYLVMYDRLGEFSSGHVTAVYDGDTDETGSILSQSQQSDADGNRYYRVVMTGALSSKNITVDVTGHTPSTPAELIRYLLSFFVNEDGVYDQSSLYELERVMGVVELGMAFNNRDDRGGALKTILDRITKQLPILFIQRGKKYGFWPITWGSRTPTKTLSFDKNIIRKIDGPTETSRNEIYNSFVIKYAVSGLRGDHTGCIVQNYMNNAECLKSKERYGEHIMSDFDASDVMDSDGAIWLSNWIVETYTKMRVFISYECTFDVIDVNILDEVRVIDEYEDFDTNFKVIGINRNDGPTIGISLVSLEDYTEIYKVGVN